MEHVKSVLEASVDYHYPNHPEPEAEPGDMGEVSDGYHTFNELYRYRMLYNAAFFNLLARNGQVEVCKSRRHSDGEKCFGSDDWFIVMAILPTGQVSNHYESKYWDLFDVPERETAFEYDGHTPNEAADRLKKYLKLPRRGMTFEQALERLKLGRKIKRIDWGKKYICLRFSVLGCLIKCCITIKYSLFMEGENQGVSISGISTEKIQKMFHAKSLNSLEGRGIRLY